MKPYCTIKLGRDCDVSEIRAEGRKSCIGRLPETGGDYRGYIKNKAVKRQTRRHLKRSDRQHQQKETQVELAEMRQEKHERWQESDAQEASFYEERERQWERDYARQCAQDLDDQFWEEDSRDLTFDVDCEEDGSDDYRTYWEIYD